MSSIDGPVARRSLALMYPGAAIHLSEVMGQSVATEMGKFLSDPMAKQEPPNFNPAPGQGPPAWILEKGGMDGQGLAARGAPNAAQVRLHMSCHGDPGYQATAKWSVEFSLALGQEGPRGGAGGYLTPTSALGPQALEERLSQADGGRLCSFWTGS